MALLGGVLTTACSSAPNEAATLPPAPTTTSASVAPTPTATTATANPDAVPAEAPVGDDSDDAAVATAQVYARSIGDADVSQDVSDIFPYTTEDCPCRDVVWRLIQRQKEDGVKLDKAPISSVQARLLTRDGDQARVRVDFEVTPTTIRDAETNEVIRETEGRPVSGVFNLRYEEDRWLVFFVEDVTNNAS